MDTVYSFDLWGATASTVVTDSRALGSGVILDPRTAAPAERVWRSATVVASTCAGANTSSTAAVGVRAEPPGWLGERRYPPCIVDRRHRVVRVGDWPAEGVAA